MSVKNINYDIDARSALKRGVDKLADAVKVTLGQKAGMLSSIRNSVPRP